MKRFVYVTLATLLLGGCAAPSPLGKANQVNTRELWRRLAPDQYEEIIALEESDRGREESSEITVEEWLRNRRIDPYNDDDPYRVSRTKFALYVAEQIVKWADDNLDSDDPLRVALNEGERVAQWGEESLEDVRDQIRDYLGLHNAEIHFRVRSNEIGVGIRMPFNTDAEDNSFRAARRKYRLEIENQERSAAQYVKKEK